VLDSTTALVPGAQGDFALSDLAKQIVEKHQAATAALATCVEYALDAGDMLIEAKAAVGSGQFGEWVELNCKIPPRTARFYMQLARRRYVIEPAISAHSGLTLREAARIASGAPASKTATVAALGTGDRQRLPKRTSGHG
jgi:hypothetical protein